MEIIPFKDQYPELYDAALEIANRTALMIMVRANAIESTMPYKAQAILEEVVKLLEERI